MLLRLFCTMTIGLLVPAGIAVAADWPAERHDVRRSGMTDEALDAPLVEAWRVASRVPSPAWPPPHFVLLDRMDFDYSPQPVVADGVVCFASNSDDSVRAVDLATGRSLWRFVTGGPVRLAPQIDNGHVYFGSDDGLAYCVDLKTGDLVWKFVGAPHAEQFLGNGRMMSRWPIRTGVLVDDGVAYFLAGMWATEGVFAYAVDSTSGKLIWCNDTCGYAGVDYNRLLTPENAGDMRHGVHDGDFGVYGLTPQGALAVTGDVLIVPNGYNSPAGLDRKTGRLLFAEPSAGTGGHWVMTDGDAFYSIYQHRNRRILMMKKDARTGARLHLHHHSIRNVTTVPNTVPHLNHEVGRTRVLMREGRAISRNAFSLVLAGKTLVVGRDGYVTARDRETDAELWRGKVDGKAYGLAVADGRVIATTDRGTVYCFATKASVGGSEAGTAPGESTAGAPGRQLANTLKKAGIDRGYALVIGDTTGRLSRFVARTTSLRVIAHADDEKSAAALRTQLVDFENYGMKLHVPKSRTGSSNTLPYAQHFANTVIVTDRTTIPSDELFRVLRPCGGTLVFLDGGKVEAERVSADLSQQLQDGEASFKDDETIPTIVRNQLPGALDWDSKQLADQRARWPLRPLWFGGPTSAQVTDFKNVNARPPAAYGRYFVQGEDTLTAVDAYNGFVLWTRPIPKRAPDLKPVAGLLHYTGQVWSRELRDAHRRGVRADDKHVYLYLGEGDFRNKSNGCIVLDAATGRQKSVYAPFTQPAAFVLDQPRTWPVEIDATHSGRVTLTRFDDGLIVELETTDPKVTQLDHWELFFDFRPADQRYGLYDRGVFRVRITPAYLNGPPARGEGDKHPELQISSRPSRSGSSVSALLKWQSIGQLTGSRPDSFGFAAIVNSHDGNPDERFGRGYLFCDHAAAGINNGWANIFLNSAPVSEAQKPAVVAGTLADLPKLQITPIWPKAINPQVSSQQRIHPLTGELGPRIFRSGTGTCGGFDFSATSVVKRSGAAKVLGVYDFADDSGLHSFIGVSAGCNATTTTALGMMIVSESKARCVCTFPYRTTVTLAPDQRRLQEDWAIFYDRDVDTQVRQAHINLGAFGDRRDANGDLWLGFPRPVERTQALGYPKLPGTKSEAFLAGVWPIGQSANLHVPLEVEFNEGGGPYRFNADRTPVHGTDRPWTYTSGYRGIRTATLKLNFLQPLVARALSQSPNIDARLQNDEWPSKPELTLPGTKTDVYVAHDAAALYVAARRTAKVDRRGNPTWKSETKGDDAQVWNDSSWELFLGDTSSPHVIHLGVSISGARFDAIGQRAGTTEDANWNGTWESASTANQQAAIVELAIPWKTIEAAGLKRDQLAMNFLVNRDAKAGEAITYLGAKGRAGCSNLTPVGINSPPSIPTRRFRVRLHFAQPPDHPPVSPFDVFLQGKESGRIELTEKSKHPVAIVHEFRNIEATESLSLGFRSVDRDERINGAPVLCALEVNEEQ